MLYFTESEIKVLKEFAQSLMQDKTGKLSHDEASMLMQRLVNEIYFKKEKQNG